jgi:flagellar protein FliS
MPTMNPPRLRAASAYRNIGIETRAHKHDQHQLATLMFEAVLESLSAAQGAINDRDVNAKVKHLNKAVRILQDGLRTSLDLENGGELAANLDALYDYAVLQITTANLHNDALKLAAVADLIRPIAEAWQQIRPGSEAPRQTPNATSDGSTSAVYNATGNGNLAAKSHITNAYALVGA